MIQGYMIFSIIISRMVDTCEHCDEYFLVHIPSCSNLTLTFNGNELYYVNKILIELYEIRQRLVLEIAETRIFVHSLFTKWVPGYGTLAPLIRGNYGYNGGFLRPFVSWATCFAIGERF